MYEEEEMEVKRRPSRHVRGTVDEDHRDPVLMKLDKILKTQEENFESWKTNLETRLSSLEKNSVANPHPENGSINFPPNPPCASGNGCYSETSITRSPIPALMSLKSRPSKSFDWLVFSSTE